MFCAVSPLNLISSLRTNQVSRLIGGLGNYVFKSQKIVRQRLLELVEARIASLNDPTSERPVRSAAHVSRNVLMATGGRYAMAH